jgi:hypothetical protein
MGYGVGGILWNPLEWVGSRTSPWKCLMKVSNTVTNQCQFMSSSFFLWVHAIRFFRTFLIFLKWKSFLLWCCCILVWSCSIVRIQLPTGLAVTCIWHQSCSCPYYYSLCGRCMLPKFITTWIKTKGSKYEPESYHLVWGPYTVGTCGYSSLQLFKVMLTCAVFYSS